MVRKKLQNSESFCKAIGSIDSRVCKPLFLPSLQVIQGQDLRNFIENQKQQKKSLWFQAQDWLVKR